MDVERLRGNGQPAVDARYSVEVTAEYRRGPASASHRIVLDTRFLPPAIVAEQYGAPGSEPNKVYPRSTEVLDALPITAVAERFLERAHLTIRSETGRLVARRDIKAGQRDPSGWRFDLAWTGRRSGKPLPVGRYRAVVTGVDKAGNAGRSRALRLFVSADHLTWRDETRILVAAENDVTSILCGYLSVANGCLDYFASLCGHVVPSDVFAGGLSHQSKLCPPPSGPESPLNPQALSAHLLSVPEAIRGIDRTRVGFGGSPTYSGETDPGTLAIDGTTTTSAIEASSPWVEAPALGNGRPAAYPLARIPPSVYWEFSTSGDDAFDVYTFTVDLRYLVVES